MRTWWGSPEGELLRFVHWIHCFKLCSNQTGLAQWTCRFGHAGSRSFRTNSEHRALATVYVPYVFQAPNPTYSPMRQSLTFCPFCTCPIAAVVYPHEGKSRVIRLRRTAIAGPAATSW